MLFHLIGQTEKAQISALDETTGLPTGKLVEAHRALYIISNELGLAERAHLSTLLPVPRRTSAGRR
jgi:hypothetical protein